MKYNRLNFYKQKICQDCGNKMFRGRTAKRCLDCDGKLVDKLQKDFFMRMQARREAKKSQEAHA